jgi:hypothetical protein
MHLPPYAFIVWTGTPLPLPEQNVHDNAMLFREITHVWCEKRMEHINTLRGTVLQQVANIITAGMYTFNSQSLSHNYI